MSGSMFAFRPEAREFIPGSAPAPVDSDAPGSNTDVPPISASPVRSSTLTASAKSPAPFSSSCHISSSSLSSGLQTTANSQSLNSKSTNHNASLSSSWTKLNPDAPPFVPGPCLGSATTATSFGTVGSSCQQPAAASLAGELTAPHSAGIMPPPSRTPPSVVSAEYLHSGQDNNPTGSVVPVARHNMILRPHQQGHPHTTYYNTPRGTRSNTSSSSGGYENEDSTVNGKCGLGVNRYETTPASGNEAYALANNVGSEHCAHNAGVTHFGGHPPHHSSDSNKIALTAPYTYMPLTSPSASSNIPYSQALLYDEPSQELVMPSGTALMCQPPPPSGGASHIASNLSPVPSIDHLSSPPPGPGGSLGVVPPPSIYPHPSMFLQLNGGRFGPPPLSGYPPAVATVGPQFIGSTPYGVPSAVYMPTLGNQGAPCVLMSNVTKGDSAAPVPLMRHNSESSTTVIEEQQRPLLGSIDYGNGFDALSEHTTGLNTSRFEDCTGNNVLRHYHHRPLADPGHFGHQQSSSDFNVHHSSSPPKGQQPHPQGHYFNPNRGGSFHATSTTSSVGNNRRGSPFQTSIIANTNNNNNNHNNNNNNNNNNSNDKKSNSSHRSLIRNDAADTMSVVEKEKIEKSSVERNHTETSSSMDDPSFSCGSAAQDVSVSNMGGGTEQEKTSGSATKTTSWAERVKRTPLRQQRHNSNFDKGAFSLGKSSASSGTISNSSGNNASAQQPLKSSTVGRLSNEFNNNDSIGGQFSSVSSESSESVKASLTASTIPRQNNRGIASRPKGQTSTRSGTADNHGSIRNVGMTPSQTSDVMTAVGASETHTQPLEPPPPMLPGGNSYKDGLLTSVTRFTPDAAQFILNRSICSDTSGVIQQNSISTSSTFVAARRLPTSTSSRATVAGGTISESPSTRRRIENAPLMATTRRPSPPCNSNSLVFGTIGVNETLTGGVVLRSSMPFEKSKTAGMDAGSSCQQEQQPPFLPEKNENLILETTASCGFKDVVHNDGAAVTNKHLSETFAQKDTKIESGSLTENQKEESSEACNLKETKGHDIEEIEIVRSDINDTNIVASTTVEEHQTTVIEINTEKEKDDTEQNLQERGVESIIKHHGIKDEEAPRNVNDGLSEQLEEHIEDHNSSNSPETEILSSEDDDEVLGFDDREENYEDDEDDDDDDDDAPEGNSSVASGDIESATLIASCTQQLHYSIPTLLHIRRLMSTGISLPSNEQQDIITLPDGTQRYSIPFLMSQRPGSNVNATICIPDSIRKRDSGLGGSPCQAILGEDGWRGSTRGLRINASSSKLLLTPSTGGSRSGITAMLGGGGGGGTSTATLKRRTGLERSSSSRDIRREDIWRAAKPSAPENSRLAKASQITDHAQLVHRKLRSVLNKLTFEKFDVLYEQIKIAGMTNETDVQGLMELICSKAKVQHHFIPMYVRLCSRLNEDLPEMKLINAGTSHFRRLLVDACQVSFEETLKPIVVPEGLSEEDGFEYTLLEKKKMKGNMIFVAELSKKKIIAAKILKSCMEVLIQNRGEPQLEALCELMTTAGCHMCSNPKLRPAVSQGMTEIEQLAKSEALSIRIRCLLQDIVDDFKSDWKKSTKEKEGPQTLQQLQQSASESAAAAAVAVSTNVVGRPGFSGSSSGLNSMRISTVSNSSGSSRPGTSSLTSIDTHIFSSNNNLQGNIFKPSTGDDTFQPVLSKRGIKTARNASQRDLTRLTSSKAGLSSPISASLPESISNTTGRFDGLKSSSNSVSSFRTGSLQSANFSNTTSNNFDGSTTTATKLPVSPSKQEPQRALESFFASELPTPPMGLVETGPLQKPSLIMPFSVSGSIDHEKPSYYHERQTTVTNTSTDSIGKSGKNSSVVLSSSVVKENQLLPQRKKKIDFDKDQWNDILETIAGQISSPSAIEVGLATMRESVEATEIKEDHWIDLVSLCIFLISDARSQKQPLLADWLMSWCTSGLISSHILEEGINDFCAYRFESTKCDCPNLASVLHNYVLEKAKEKHILSDAYIDVARSEIKRLDALEVLD